MSSHDVEPGGGTGDPGRVDNGLRAPRYVALTDVDSALGQRLLIALGRARIPAYLDVRAADPQRRRLFVASDERVDARTIVAAAVRALDEPDRTDASTSTAGDTTAGSGTSAPTPPPATPTDAVQPDDTKAAFDALVAGWKVDTIAAVRDAERDLTREDADWRMRLNRPPAGDEVWLDEDHYVPPPPPPLPRLARTTVIGIVVVVLSILLLAFGTELGLADDFTFVLGIGGLVVAAGIFFTRVRDFHRDEDDDGSAV